MITVTDYHQRTKHGLQGYAAAPEALDWNDQPNPFRRFEGSPIFNLSKPGKQLAVTWSDLEQPSRQASELNPENLSLLLELAFGLSAWKQYGPNRWALRNNPSSGNLHPTEAYLVNGVAALVPQGVYHYVSSEHQLEQRCQFANKALDDSLLIGLSSIHWREAWKYGERAFRYCQLDIGHVLAALSYAATTLGWRIELLSAYSDADIASILGLQDKDQFIAKEMETVDLICRIHYTENSINPLDADSERDELLQSIQQTTWQGRAQSLGAYHVYHWPVIDEVSQQAVKKDRITSHWQSDKIPLIKSACDLPATQLIRQRRSAQQFNARSEPISQQKFFRILAALFPADKSPFDAWNWAPAVHLCLFIHKVEGLQPGLYCLPRSENGVELLKQQLTANFKWQPVAEFPQLYLLQEGDARKPAKTLSCHQTIASDSAFSLAMLTEFKDQLSDQPWHYRRLFWECGLIGQVLYLEAESAELRGTGIGCFFDDNVHDLLGLKDNTLQSLYHFTVGEPLEDARIQSFPAYGHLGGSVSSAG